MENRKKIADKCMKAIRSIRKQRDEMRTEWVELETIGNNKWAIVFSYLDCEDYDESCAEFVDEDGSGYALFAKLAYLPLSSYFSDYYEWNFPVDKDGEVIDTQLLIPKQTDENIDDLFYLIDEVWDEVRPMARIQTLKEVWDEFDFPDELEFIAWLAKNSYSMKELKKIGVDRKYIKMVCKEYDIM